MADVRKEKRSGMAYFLTTRRRREVVGCFRHQRSATNCSGLAMSALGSHDRGQNPKSSVSANAFPVCPRQETYRTTPAANSLRMPPSRPRASLRSRASACDPHDVQSGHVSLLVPNLPRQVAQRRSPTRGIRAPSETLPRRPRRSNRPSAGAARASSRPAARRRACWGRA